MCPVPFPASRQVSISSVRLWDVKNPDALPIVLLRHDEPVELDEYIPDGKRLIVGAVKSIMIWDLTHARNISPAKEVADKVCQIVCRNLSLEEWHKFVGVELPYERTCPNLPIHPGLFEAAGKMAKENDIEAAVNLLARAVEIAPELAFDPEQEALRLAQNPAPSKFARASQRSRKVIPR